MKTQLKTWLGRFDGLSGREQVLLTVTAVAVLAVAVQFGWVAPRRAEAQANAARIQRQAAELGRLQGAVRDLATRRAAAPLGPQQAERDALRQSLQEAQALVARASGQARMGEVIRVLVAENPGLVLASLKTLPSSAFFQPPAAAAPASVPALYRHGVEVAVKGSYLDLLAYVRRLEQAVPGLFWEEGRLDVAEYPEATLRLKLHILSTQPEALAP